MIVLWKMGVSILAFIKISTQEMTILGCTLNRRPVSYIILHLKVEIQKKLIKNVLERGLILENRHSVIIALDIKF